MWRHPGPKGDLVVVTKTPSMESKVEEDAKIQRVVRFNRASKIPQSSLAMLRSSGIWAPLPERIHTTLKYADRFSVNPGAGTLGIYVISANGLYDPNITGTGHQPKGFDQLIALYDHYCVTKAHIKVTWCPDPTSCNLLGVTQSGSATSTYSDPTDYVELPGTHWTSSGYISTSGHSETKTVSTTMNVSKFLGVKDLLDGRDNCGDGTQNPNEGVFFHLWAAAMNGATDLGSIVGFVEVTYDAWFVEPRDVSSS